MGLKAFLGSIMIALTVMAVGVALSLILITTLLDGAVNQLRESVESVRLAEELQVDLLLHTRSQDDMVRAEKESRLRHMLAQARRYISTQHEQEVLTKAEQKIETYLKEARGRSGLPSPAVDPTRHEAFALLEELVQTNVEQAREAQAEAARLNGLANVVGGTTAVVFLLGIMAFLLWLRTFAFRPVFEIARAMRRFGQGDKTARAPESGPAELREMAQSFNGMASALERQHESQMAFLAGVAHDLRTPLSALKTSAAILDGQIPRLPPERVGQVLSLIHRQVAQLERMAGDFLDATRIESGRLELKLEDQDARTIARETYELFRSSSPRHEVQLRLPADPLRLHCDPTRIGQVLNNFTSNAIKYSPAGGEVVIAVERDGGEIVFSVSDQGIGIGPEEKSQIFEPFRRARTSRDAIPGTGLGLFVARRIVETHGGRIEVESSPGSGSIFRLRVPGTQPKSHLRPIRGGRGEEVQGAG
ncbi:MAG TPA: HAMP domain-containing sensor histidine kinase [Thermoanaerobaculia bacterium]|nr:HAMP domain-containing sensor histidine kinase [Thermoanaerobaculia bacterium]